MPTLRGDIEFLKNKSKQVFGTGRNIVSNTLSNTRQSSIVKTVEFGAFNWLRVFGAIMIALFFLIIFSAWHSESGIWVVLFIFLLAYGFFFRGDEKRSGGITGFLFNGFLGIITTLFAVVTGFFTAVFEIIKDIFIGATDTGGGLIGWIIDLVKDIGSDVVSFATEITLMIVGIVKELFEMIRDICVDIVVSLFNVVREVTIDVSIGLGTALYEISTDIITSIIDAIKEIFSSFGEMLTDMVTFNKKES